MNKRLTAYVAVLIVGGSITALWLFGWSQVASDLLGDFRRNARCK